MAEPGHSPRPSTQVGATASSELGPPENTFTTRLKSLVENCVYGMLMQRFHKKGRGRPPDLPKGLPVTNKLLVQLYFLKGQHYSYADLKTWLADVDPNTTHVSEGRIIYRLDVILRHCDTLQTSLEQLEQYLDVNVDFNNLSQALSSIGLNRLHFSGDAQFLQPPVENLPNSVVYELEKYRSVNNETYTFVYKWLRTLCIPLVNLSDKQFKNKIKTVVSKCKTFSKKRDINGLNIYLECMFLQNIAIIESVESDSESAKQASSLRKRENEYSEIEKRNKQLGDEIKDLKAELGIKNEIINKDCPKLRNENNSLGLTVKELKNELKELKKERDMLCKQNEEIQSSTLYKSNFEYKKKLNDLRDENKCLLESIEKDREQSRRAISKLKLKIKTEQSLKSLYKSSLAKEKEKKEQLQKMLQFDQDSQQILIRNDGSSHSYSHNTRKTFYALQGEGNVAAINCSKVISIVAQNFFNVNVTEDHLPCATSSLNFSNEAHVIAKSQISDEIINADHFTYACDGTSRQKASYLEKHIILSNGKQLSLGYSEVVTEDSNTLLETCISALKEIVEIRCINEDEDVINKSDLFKNIIRKMKGLLSDRAAVMKAFDKKMSEYKLDILQGEDASTYFLFCNAHFLLALSTACEEAVQTLEEDMIQDSGKKLGRDANPKFSRFAGEKECATLRLLRTASKVLGPRGDEKSGCRQNWLAYCHQKKKRSLFTSYRNNRFNNVFVNATATLHHKEDILDFLKNFNTHNNTLLDSVREDLEDSRLMTNVAVLSFIHIFLTEPYWQLMNSDKKYADFPPYVQKMDSIFSLWSNDEMFDPTVACVVFEDFPANEFYLSIIVNFLESTNYDLFSFQSKISKIANNCSAALHRQLGDFLPDGLFGNELDENVKAVLKTCPLTNLTGERQFGDLDYCMNTRRNCSLFMRSTRSMWKHNKITKYLTKKSPSVSQKLLEKAIKYGPIMKIRSIEIKKALMKRRIDVGDGQRKKRNDLEISKLNRKRAAIDAIMSRDSLIVSTRSELDKIYSGPQSLQRLKEQVRYRNVVGGHKIKITGKKKDLYERLLENIGEASSSGI